MTDVKFDELNSLLPYKYTLYDNANRNSDIYIKGGLVYKIYTLEDERTSSNIYTLRKLIILKEAFANIPEIVFPNDLLTCNDKIIGFVMNEIKGKTLMEYIINNELSTEELKSIYLKISNLISKMKSLAFTVSIGDLHERNIIIDDSLDIHIIDPDSFIINNKPNKYMEKDYYGEYITDGLKKSINKDELCLLAIIINQVFKDIFHGCNNVIELVRKDRRFKKLHNLIDKCKNEKGFNLEESDINLIFDLKNQMDSNYNVEVDVYSEFKRIRNMLKG